METTLSDQNMNPEKGKLIKVDDKTKTLLTAGMQENRSILRERYLRLLTSLCSQPAQFYMHENTNVEADFCGADVDGIHFFVRNLKTPLGVQPSALLRSNDILNIKILLEKES